MAHDDRHDASVPGHVTPGAGSTWEADSPQTWGGGLAFSLPALERTEHTCSHSLQGLSKLRYQKGGGKTLLREQKKPAFLLLVGTRLDMAHELASELNGQLPAAQGLPLAGQQ